MNWYKSDQSLGDNDRALFNVDKTVGLYTLTIKSLKQEDENVYRFVCKNDKGTAESRCNLIVKGNIF